MANYGEGQMPEQGQRKLGRPPKAMPEPIPDTPENVARACMQGPPKPKEEWRYLKKEKKSG